MNLHSKTRRGVQQDQADGHDSDDDPLIRLSSSSKARLRAQEPGTEGRQQVNESQQTNSPEQLYGVDEILGKRIRKGVVQYKVRWQNETAEQATWEPEQNLSHCAHLTAKFANETQSESGSDEEYTVDDIVDVKVSRGKRFFKVQWTGYSRSDDTWEPESQVRHLAAYERFLIENAEKNPKAAGNGGKRQRTTTTPARPKKAPAKPKRKRSATKKTSQPAAKEKRGQAEAKGETRARIDEHEYYVEKLCGYKLINGKHMYSVRWKGYGPADDTWEPEDNLRHLDAFRAFKTLRRDAK